MIASVVNVSTGLPGQGKTLSVMHVVDTLRKQEVASSEDGMSTMTIERTTVWVSGTEFITSKDILERIAEKIQFADNRNRENSPGRSDVDNDIASMSTSHGSSNKKPRSSPIGALFGTVAKQHPIGALRKRFTECGGSPSRGADQQTRRLVVVVIDEIHRAPKQAIEELLKLAHDCHHSCLFLIGIANDLQYRLNNRATMTKIFEPYTAEALQGIIRKKVGDLVDNNGVKYLASTVVNKQGMWGMRV